MWSHDLIVARTADGRGFRILTLLDDTSGCLKTLVDRRITSRTLSKNYSIYSHSGAPQMHIRSDNDPEFTAKAVRRWLKKLEVTTLFVERGSPWENGYSVKDTICENKKVNEKGRGTVVEKST